MSVNIIVLAKQVPDPEGPPSAFEVDSAAKKVIPKGIPPVINPFDENALEAAIRIKEEQGGKITLLTLGKGISKAVILKATAAGADESCLVEGDDFDAPLLDSYATANLLAAAIRKVGEYDLILCGRQAADWDAGQVGSGIAEILGIPSITPIKNVEWSDGKLKVERVITDGYEVIEAAPPLLVAVSNELGEPRYPKLKGIMAAAKKEVPTWTAADIGADAARLGAAGARATLTRLFVPVKEGKCEIIEGESPEESAVALAEKLREVRLI